MVKHKGYSIDNRKLLCYINSTDMAWGSPILMCVFCKNKLGVVTSLIFFIFKLHIKYRSFLSPIIRREKGL